MFDTASDHPVLPSDWMAMVTSGSATTAKREERRQTNLPRSSRASTNRFLSPNRDKQCIVKTAVPAQRTHDPFGHRVGVLVAIRSEVVRQLFSLRNISIVSTVGTMSASFVFNDDMGLAPVPLSFAESVVVTEHGQFPNANCRRVQ